MSDESHMDIADKKETLNSLSNEDNYVYHHSSSSEHNQQETLLTDDNRNHIHDQTNLHENLSNIQTSDNSLNQSDSSEETPLNSELIHFSTESDEKQINNQQDSFNQNPISSQHFNTASNQNHADLSSVEQLLSNIQHQPDPFKSQRQSDDDDIPSAEPELNEISINHHNDESSTVTHSTIDDNRILTELETPYEHHHESYLIPTETILDETNNSSTESQSSSNDNSPSNESEKVDNNVHSVDSTNDSSIESTSNSTDNSPLNESNKVNEDEIPIVEPILNATTDSSIESQSSSNDNSSLNESEKLDDDKQKIDIIPSESTIDNHIETEVEISNQDHQINESSSVELSINQTATNVETNINDIPLLQSTVDQTNNSSTESESNLSDHLLLDKSEKIPENDVPLNESTHDQTNSSSIDSQSSSTDNSPSMEPEKVDEDHHENDTGLVESIVNQTNDSSIEVESNSMDHHDLVESEKINEDYHKIDIRPVDETKNSSIKLESNLINNDHLTEFEKTNEDNYKNEETNIPLKSSLLSDVVSETLEENSNDLSSERIELEKESTEDITIKNENDILDNIVTNLTKTSTDIEEKLDRKSNNLNKQEEEESLLSNSKLISSEFEDILGNKTLLKQTIVKGELNSRPTRSTMVTVSYKLSLIDNLTSNIHLIENVSNERFFASEGDIIQAIDICVQTMDRGECALIDSDIRHCYGDIGCLEKQIPPVSSNNSYRMKIELELHDWQSPPDVQKLSIDERLYWGDKKRQMGNFHYRRQDYLTSLQCYNGALRFLDTDINPILISFNEDQRSILNDAFIQVENNVAQVNLLLNKYDACLHAVENVLKHDPKNVKALFRQGKAFFQLGLYDKAIQPLKLFIQIQKGNPNSASDREKVNEMIQICENKLANYQKNEKEIYQRMFRPKTEKRQINNTNQIDNTNNSWWPYIAIGTAVFTTLAIVTFIKHRNTS
ncbi:unnamed protein product [Rotaria sp. Silwood1]|nr:unnamed protein product [Rotaria sp. Silwood1]